MASIIAHCYAHSIPAPLWCGDPATPPTLGRTDDAPSLEILRTQLKSIGERAAAVGEQLVDDPYIFTDSLDGSESWHPDAITQYFGRLRDRLDLKHVTVKSLRAFMDTYGQDLGFTLTQVALRAGHDPAVASRHYTGKVSKTDREIAEALSDLLGGGVFQ